MDSDVNDNTTVQFNKCLTLFILFLKVFVNKTMKVPRDIHTDC